MLFGLPTNPAKNLVEEIRKIKEWGFDFVEISIETPLKKISKRIQKEITEKIIENFMKNLLEQATKSLAVENVLPPQLSDIEDLKEMLDKKEIEELAKKFRRRIIHLHVHDNNGKVDEHLPLGVGTINFKGIAKTIKQLKNCKTVVLEIHRGRGEHILLSRKLFEEIWC